MKEKSLEFQIFRTALVCLILIAIYAAIYRFFKADYIVVGFYLIGALITLVFWLKVKEGKDPSKYINLWIAMLMLYGIFAWFKTGGISGGGMSYLTAALLSVIIVQKNWRLRVVNIVLILQWLLILLDYYLPDLPIWGENEKIIYDYMIVSFVIILVVTRLKNNFDTQQTRALQFQTGLRKLYDLQALRHLPTNSLMEQYLLVGTEALRLKNGFIARVHNDSDIEIVVKLQDEERFPQFLTSGILKTTQLDELTIFKPGKKKSIYPRRLHKGFFYAGLPLVVDHHTIGVIGFYDERSAKQDLEGFEQELFEMMQGNIESLLDLKNLKASRKEVNKALIFSEEKFKSIYDNAEIGICLTDLDGEIVMANNAFLDINECTEQDIIGHNFNQLAHSDDVYKDKSQYGKIIAGDIERYYIERKNITYLGNVISVSIRTSILKDENGSVQHIIRMVNDISDRKESEKKINDLNSKLEQQVKQLETAYAELESFSYSVSHDLRAPLRAIEGFTKMIKEGHRSELSNEASRLLDTVSDNSQKMTHLIEDLLTISKISRKAMTLSSIDVGELLNEIIKEYNVKSDLIVVHKLPVIMAEQTLIKQAFSNLIGNAVKFSSKEEKPKIEVGYEKKDGHYLFFVKDNGVGFDMNRYDKLFSVFQRLHKKEEFSGTGVGLAIVHRVINKHNGKIWAESKIGQGTTFYFTIPRN